MLGFGGKDNHTVDPTKLPLLVHVIQSTDGFTLAEKVWQTNERNRRVDQSNNKELQRFVFANPACVVWLQRDLDRKDTFELILMWDNEKTDDVTEVYVISRPVSGQPVGDDVRAKSLLGAILATPATVPVNGEGI